MQPPIQKVMLIDDEKIDQRQYARVLERSELVGDVMVFTYADEALQYLRETPDAGFDVIFLDINIPRMDGFEFLEQATKEFGADFTSCVVAMLTTSLNPDDEMRARNFSAVKAFINKPLNNTHLNLVADILAEVSANRRIAS